MSKSVAYVSFLPLSLLCSHFVLFVMVSLFSNNRLLLPKFCNVLLLFDNFDKKRFSFQCVYNIFIIQRVYNLFSVQCVYDLFSVQCVYNLFCVQCVYNLFSVQCVYNLFSVQCVYNLFSVQCV